MWLYIVATVVVGGVIAFYKYLWKGYEYWTKRGVYVPSVDNNITFLQVMTSKKGLQDFQKQFYDLARKKKEKYYGLMEILVPVLFVTDLDLLKRIFVKDFDNFINRKDFSKIKKGNEVFTKMLIALEDAEWKNVRTIITPTFTTGKIKTLFEIVNLSGERMISFLNEECKINDCIDLQDTMGRVAMDMIASSAFGFESNIFKDKNSTFAKMGKGLVVNLSAGQLIKAVLLFAFPQWMSRFIEVKVFNQDSLDFFSDIVQMSIKLREESGQERNDFLQLILQARSGQLKPDDDELSACEVNNSGNKSSKSVSLSDDLILAQCIVFIVGGYDTTSTLLTFASLQLAILPDIQTRLFKHIENGLEENEGKFSYKLINRLEYLDMFINETLRMYPSFIQLDRRCAADYKIPNSDLILSKGTNITIPLYAIHHDEEYWPEPEKFDPERFSAENKANRNPYAFMPFGHGQRSCIAMRFALTQAKTTIARLVYNFIIEPSEKTEIPITLAKGSILKPKGGAWLKLKPRTQ